MPDWITFIDDYAFMYCKSLKEIVIPDAVISIGTQAFDNCISLKKITIGNHISLIKHFAFQGCNSIEEVHIKNLSSWLAIDFSNKYSNPLVNNSKLYLGSTIITEMTIPNNIKEIKKHAFDGCGSITDIIISDNVIQIGDYAFRNLNNLGQINIGKGVNNIGKNVFTGTSISKWYCHNTTPPKITPETFYGAIKEETILYVPNGSSTTYQASNWADYFINIKDMD